MISWTEKHRPKTLTEIVGHKSEIKKLREWAKDWTVGDPALILYGVPGVGKTTAAHALANDIGWEVMEMNASDKRTKSLVQKIGGEASRSGTLGEGNEGIKLVILDEADNLSGNADRGGKSAMTDIVKSTQQPVILVANDFYNMSRTLRNNCDSIEFGDIDESEIARTLQEICKEEDVEFQASVLKKIAAQSKGDLRSAINDLQAAVVDGEVTAVSVSTSERDRGVDIFPYMDSVFKEKDPQTVQNQSMDLNETPDDLIRWIEENVAKVYNEDELKQAYEYIARADAWLGRVRSTQQYSYWKYASANMTAGVSAARSERKGGWTRYSPPSYNSRNSTAQSVAEKISVVSGVSTSTAINAVIPYLSAMTHHCKPKEITIQMTAHYGFDEKEVSHITGSGETTNKVENIVEKAEVRREEEGIQTPLDTDNSDDETQEDEVEDGATEIDENIDEGEDKEEDAENEEMEDEERQPGLDEFI